MGAKNSRNTPSIRYCITKVKPGQLITLGFALGLLTLAVDGLAYAKETPPQTSVAMYLAAADTDDEEDEDEEEEAVNYRDRVREVQQWMSRRDTERKGGAPGLDVAPSETPALSTPYPRYFQSRGDDGNGYRRLNRDVRVRLHTPRSYYGRRHHGHSSWHRGPHSSGRHHGHSQHYRYSGTARHSHGQPHHSFHSDDRSRHYSAYPSHHANHPLSKKHAVALPHHAGKAHASSHAKAGKKGRSRR